MAEFVERRQGGQDRRKGPIRSGKERRDPNIPPPSWATRSGNDRRHAERRKGDRRKSG